MADVLDGVPSARANEWMCALYSVFSTRRYVDAYVADMVAANKSTADGSWQKSVDEHPEALAGCLAEWRNDGRAGVASLRKRTILSAALTAAAVAGAVSFGMVANVVRLDLPMSVPKALIFSGTALMAWATILGLGAPVMTWDGPALPDRLVPKLFLTIFVPGAALALFGTLF